MNEAQCRTDIKDLILDNKATLVTDLSHQGQSREIKRVTRSTLTPVATYYHIVISITKPKETSIPPASRTVANPRTQVEYPVKIEIADEAIIQSADGEEDNEAYEKMDLDFQKLCDRIVKLFKDQVSGFGTLGLRLKRAPSDADDRQIQKTNLSGTWKDTEGTSYASLYCQINFILVDQCVDDSALYS